MDKKRLDVTEAEDRNLAVDTLNALKTLLGDHMDSQRIYVADVVKEIAAHGPTLTPSAVMGALKWLGFSVVRTAKGMRLATVSEDHIGLALAQMEVLNDRSARLIELYPHETITICVRRDSVTESWYLLATDNEKRETRVDEINLGSVIYRALP